MEPRKGKISKVPPFLKEKRDVLEEKGSVSWWQQLVEDARVVSSLGNRRTDSGIQLCSEGQEKRGYTESPTVKINSPSLAATRRKQKSLSFPPVPTVNPTLHMYRNLPAKQLVPDSVNPSNLLATKE